MESNEELHIGDAIKQIVKLQGRSPSWLAKQLGCERANIYDIYIRPYIDTFLLRKISIALNYDFFLLYSSKLNINKIITAP